MKAGDKETVFKPFYRSSSTDYVGIESSLSLPFFQCSSSFFRCSPPLLLLHFPHTPFPPPPSSLPLSHHRLSIAPERLQGRIDFSSDVYSLGCLLYRLLTGTSYKPLLGGFSLAIQASIPPGLPLQGQCLSYPSLFPFLLLARYSPHSPTI